MDSIEITSKLKQAKPYLEENFHVNEIGFFGSFARGDADENSDIDILVGFSKIPGWDFFALEDYLENLLGKKIDLVTKAAIRKQLKTRILQEVKYIE